MWQPQLFYIQPKVNYNPHSKENKDKLAGEARAVKQVPASGRESCCFVYHIEQASTVHTKPKINMDNPGNPRGGQFVHFRRVTNHLVWFGYDFGAHIQHL